MYEYSWFLLLQEIDVILLFAVKQFEVISLSEMNCDTVDEATNNTTELPVFFCSVNDNSAAAHSHSLVLLMFLLISLPPKMLSLQTQAVCFVQIVQSIVKLNSNAMAIPGRGNCQLLLWSHQQYVHLASAF